ncbi:hypothetical protein E3N88_32966 [Mikania micrantha]|uniref:Uncharacterized protein n=1 Tax=Mikania micrantha TaxID=192012 RepID=A0A5N6MAK2_9ASTR|nr:hypothetical protein E3N88_32966 [Mikania micrantha]
MLLKKMLKTLDRHCVFRRRRRRCRGVLSCSQMDSSSILVAALSSKQNELDAFMGTTTRIPRLSSAAAFPEWKFRFEKHIRSKEPRLCRVILRCKRKITYKYIEGNELIKDPEHYTEEDFQIIEED